MRLLIIAYGIMSLRSYWWLLNRRLLRISAKPLASFGIILVCCFFAIQPIVFADPPLPDTEINALNNFPTWSSQPNACGDSNAENVNFTMPHLGTPTPTYGGSWNSGLTEPYIVEQYAIQILADLAARKSHPATDAVTPQHILALVSWAIMEGGDINNKSLFNLYNSGQRDADFIAGSHTINGLGSYVSFDAGVEEVARNIADGRHDGMMNDLLQPTSSAEDFAHAESNSGVTSVYPGTDIWAEAAHNDPTGYEKQWKEVIDEVKSDYNNKASYIIGTNDFEEIVDKRAPGQLAGFNKSGDSSSSISSVIDAVNAGTLPQGCSGPIATDVSEANVKAACDPSRTGVVQVRSVIIEALSLAWCDHSHGRDKRPTYAATFAKFPASSDGLDCGVFVSTVMHASSVDPDYPSVGTGNQWKYVTEHPDRYDVKMDIPVLKNGITDPDLQPGDILIVGGPNPGSADGHTMIYLGKLNGLNPDYNEASASWSSHEENKRAPNAGYDNLYDGSAPAPYQLYLRARFKGA